MQLCVVWVITLADRVSCDPDSVGASREKVLLSYPASMSDDRQPAPDLDYVRITVSLPRDVADRVAQEPKRKRSAYLANAARAMMDQEAARNANGQLFYDVTSGASDGDMAKIEQFDAEIAQLRRTMGVDGPADASGAA